MNGIKPEEIYKTVCEQTVELVFTAHPTQVCTRDSHFLAPFDVSLSAVGLMGDMCLFQGLLADIG